MNMTEWSFLYGFSYARIAGYIPKSFPNIQDKLIKIVKEEEGVYHNYIFDRTLVQQFIDSYGKLGFLYYGIEHLKYLSSKPSKPYGYYYHLYNLVYDTKAFFDAVSVLLNHVYGIGAIGGNIDIKHGAFRSRLIQKDSQFDSLFKRNQKWIDEVVNWRDSLIHKFSIVITTGITGTPGKTLSKEELDKHFSENPQYLMESKPIPFFGWGINPIPEYKPDLIEIMPFCDRWSKNAFEFYDEICDLILKEITMSL